MSLIFNALQQSRKTSRPGADMDAAPVPPDKPGGIRQWLTSPGLAIAAAGVMVLSGLGAIQAVRYLSPTIEPLAAPPVEAATATRSGGLVTHPVNLAQPAPGDTPDQSAAMKLDVAFHPASGSEDAIHPVSRQTPEPQSETNAQAMAVAVFQPPAQPPNSADHAPYDREDGGAIEETPADQMAAQAPPLSSSQRRLPIVTVNASQRKDTQHQRQAAQASAHAAVSRTADKLRVAIQSGNSERSIRLLEELAALKGPDHAFVRKLTAYMHIHNGDLDAAREILAAILKVQPDDYEAGLNLAVVDIRANRMDAARQRLIRLQEQYPERTAIARHLRQLHPN